MRGATDEVLEEIEHLPPLGVLASLLWNIYGTNRWCRQGGTCKYAEGGILFQRRNIVEYTDEFGAWWDDVAAIVQQLERRGPMLPFLYSSGIIGSRHAHLRELRVQSGGRPLRIFYAFDPRRVAILLIGGDKTGDKRFYERFIPIADRLYNEHLEELRKEAADGR